MINYHITGLYKTTCDKTKSNFSQFFFSLCLLHKCFFSFLIKAFPNFHRQAFIMYKNGETLKMLMEMFCQKLIVSNVILAILDHLKPKIFFVGQPWWPTQSATPFQNLPVYGIRDVNPSNSIMAFAAAKYFFSKQSALSIFFSQQYP